MIGVVVGSYKIVSQLGQGGMGVVYVAEHTRLGHTVVVKMLLPELSENKDVVDRFFNEAKAATRIKHPGIVQVFDFGVHEASGAAFIVMEMLDGESLNTRLRRGALGVPASIVIARQVASALGAAHKIGIIHRDLKPDNLFMVPDPDVPEKERVKVLDFGIAKLASTQSSRQTRTGEVFGTPLYMSPEQCQNAAQVDARSDIYALGCILFEMLTGRAPFVGGSLAQLITAHMFQAPTRPSDHHSGIPTALDSVVLRALAKSPDERQASMAELAAELEAATANVRKPAAGELAATAAPHAAPAPAPLAQVSRAQTPPPVQPTAPITTLGSSMGQIVARKAPKRRWAWFAGAAGAAAVAVAGVTIASLRSGAGNGSAEPAPPSSPIAAPVLAIDAAVATAVAPVDAAAAPDDNALARGRIRDALLAFLRWSSEHPDATACPPLEDVARSGTQDPWGHPMRLTCTDQPPDQLVGIVSAGPDGVFGNQDDAVSWGLGPDVTDLVRGPHWQPRTKHVTAPVVHHTTHTTAPVVVHASGSASTPPPPPPPPDPAAGSAAQHTIAIPRHR
jgi:eukaryotic-like serine/threonine-protein kinase